jgi:crossover junction endodeoxyribonuclease RuvC
MRIIGIDPGLNRTGFGIIDKSKSGLHLVTAGAIKTSNKDSIEKRLNKIFSGLMDIIKKYKPDVLVLEEVFTHTKYLATAISLGYARGIVILAAAQNSVPVKSYAAKRVKKAITGRGDAQKYQVQSMVQNTLRLKDLPSPFDVSDALALAIVYTYLK